MPDERKCPDCGGAIPPDAPSGICPRCELSGAMELSPAQGADGKRERVPGHDTVPELDKIRYFGDYELLEEIARGGMGVVFKARQVSLNRTVAIKMILAGRLASKAEVRRFRQEAEAAAKLQHPGIVAIHEVGQHEGQHYFSMDYIEGKNLTKLVREHPVSARRAAGLLQAIAEAIHFAHQHGILHRDLKPSNVLLDAAGKPHITDFGLAKRLPEDPQSSTFDLQLTVTGQVLGTPSFIAPEQANARRGEVGPASDVYSLGAILYFLLTGRPPFVADSLEATLVQVLQSEVVAPRLLNAGVPRDLETICLKCLEKEPRKRYAHAEALADELGRFLQGHSILARPVSRAEKTWRWCRRNAALAILGLSLVLVFLLGFVGVVWQWQRAEDNIQVADSLADKLRDQLDQAEQFAEKERLLRKNAQTNAQAAENARIKYERQRELAEISEDIAKKQKAAAEVAAQEATNQWKRAENALTQATNALAQAQSARQALREQKEKLEGLMEFMLYDLSTKLRRIGRADLLYAVSEKVLALYQSLPAAHDSPASFYAHDNLGHALLLQGKSAEAATAFQTGLAVLRQLEAAHPGDTNWPREELLCHQHIGDIAQSQGDAAAALREYQAGLDIAQRLAAQHPSVTDWQGYQLANHIRIGSLFESQRDPHQAFAHYTNAWAIADRLTATNSVETDWLRVLSIGYSKIGSFISEQWKLENAPEKFAGALSNATQLVEQDPGNPQLLGLLAICHDNLGDVLLVRKQVDEALTHFRNAMDIRWQLARADSANTEWQHALLHSYFKVGQLLARENRKSKLGRFIADATDAAGVAWTTHRHIVEGLVTRKRTRQSVAAVSKITEVARQLAAKDTNNLQWREDLAASHTLLGQLYLQCKENEKALAELQQALSIRKQLTLRETNTLSIQLALARSHGDVAVALARTAQPRKALAQTRAALRGLASLIGRWPGNLLLLEGPGPQEDGIGQRLTPHLAQNAEFEATFRKGFDAAASLENQPVASPKAREDWADYCLEMAVANLLFRNVRESLPYAEQAANVCQEAALTAPNSPRCRRRLLEAYVVLGAFQLCNQQPRQAIATALDGLALAPTEPACKAILVMGYYFDGQLENARANLREAEHRNLKGSLGKTFSQTVLDDLRRLQEKGFNLPDAQQLDELLPAGRAPRAE